MTNNKLQAALGTLMNLALDLPLPLPYASFKFFATQALDKRESRYR